MTTEYRAVLKYDDGEEYAYEFNNDTVTSGPYDSPAEVAKALCPRDDDPRHLSIRTREETTQ